ncbi:MAG: AI-2E family transporter [Desertifilum sp.]|nr:AI-2E family transporter [Desertifilum sp.]
MGEQRISFSISTLLLAIAIVLSLLLLWQLRGLLVILMIAVVLAASIVPLVDVAERFRIPRWLGAILVYLTAISGLSGAGLLLGPTVFQQIERLIGQFPLYVEIVRDLVERLAMRFNDTPPELLRQLFDPQALTVWLIRSSQQVLLRSYGLTKGFVGSFFSLILALFLSAYMVTDSKTLIKSIVRLFPQPWAERLEAQVPTISDRMGSYIRGRLLVSFILGMTTTVGLGFLGLRDFSLALGAIAGVTNLIPFIGPILGAVPALVVAIASGGWTFLWVLLFFAIIQNLETYVLDPFLVGSSVGVHPFYQLLAVIGGTQVLGILGALIVPPWVAGAAALVENLYLKPKELAEQQAILSPREPVEAPLPVGKPG